MKIKVPTFSGLKFLFIFDCKYTQVPVQNLVQLLRFFLLELMA